MKTAAWKRMPRRFWVGLLCLGIAVSPVGSLPHQEQSDVVTGDAPPAEELHHDGGAGVGMNTTKVGEHMARLKKHVVDNVVNKVAKSPWAKMGAKAYDRLLGKPTKPLSEEGEEHVSLQPLSGLTCVPSRWGNFGVQRTRIFLRLIAVACSCTACCAPYQGPRCQHQQRVQEAFEQNSPAHQGRCRAV